MKVLLTGANGQLGQELRSRVPKGIDLYAADRQKLDLTKSEGLIRCFNELKPDLIINAAAYTAVDRAEDEPERAHLVNTVAPTILAKLSHQAGSRMIHISTDFVFNGLKRSPYFPDDATDPIGVYGVTKRDGELGVFGNAKDSSVIIRTSWLWSRFGRNFPKTMLNLFKEKKSIKVVSDQIGCPTWAGGLASTLWRITLNPIPGGIYHWSDLGSCSWYEFAVHLASLSQFEPEIIPIPAAEFNARAKRPAYSVLDSTRVCQLMGLKNRLWQDNVDKIFS